MANLCTVPTTDAALQHAVPAQNSVLQWVVPVQDAVLQRDAPGTDAVLQQAVPNTCAAYQKAVSLRILRIRQTVQKSAAQQTGCAGCRCHVSAVWGRRLLQTNVESKCRWVHAAKETQWGKCSKAMLYTNVVKQMPCEILYRGG